MATSTVRWSQVSRTPCAITITRRPMCPMFEPRSGLGIAGLADPRQGVENVEVDEELVRPGPREEALGHELADRPPDQARTETGFRREGRDVDRRTRDRPS